MYSYLPQVMDERTCGAERVYQIALLCGKVVGWIAEGRKVEVSAISSSAFLSFHIRGLREERTTQEKRRLYTPVAGLITARSWLTEEDQRTLLVSGF